MSRPSSCTNRRPSRRISPWVLGAACLCALLAAHPGISSSSNGPRVPNELLKETTAPDSDSLPSGRPYFHVFTDKNGLPQNAAQCMTFDRAGGLWVGTQDGAAYYNGQRWKVVNMPNRTVSNYVMAIICRPDGETWFATNGGGVSVLRDGAWTTFEAQAGGLPNNQVYSLVDVSTPETVRFLIGTDDGLAIHEAGRWFVLNTWNSGLPTGRIRVVREAASSPGSRAFWIGTFGGGLVRLEIPAGTPLSTLGTSNSARVRWTTFTADNSGLPSNKVRTLLETMSPKGKRVLWIGTQGGGLARFDGDLWRVYNVGNSGLPNDTVWTLLETDFDGPERVLWAGTLGGGLARFEHPHAEDGDPRKRWAAFHTGNSDLSDNQVISLMESDAATGGPALWIGTSGGGLCRYKQDCWRTFDSASGLPNDHVWCFVESRSASNRPELWVGTGGGLGVWSEGRWRVFNTDNSGLPDNTVNTILETTSDGGGKVFWVGTASGGLARFEAGRWTVFNTSNSGLPDNQILRLLEVVSPAGVRSLWAGLNGSGVVVYRGGRWRVFNRENSPLPNNSVFGMVVTKSPSGRPLLWLGTRGGGLARVEEVSTSGTIEDAEFKWTVWNTKNSQLSNDSVMALLPTVSETGEAQLWIGTSNGGLCRMNIDAPERPWLIVSDASEPALPNNTVYHVCRDAKGRLYLPTNKGIARLTPLKARPEQASDFAIYTFTTEDGLPSNECNAGAGLVDSRGRIWTGTVSGAAAFDPGREIADRTVKRLAVERVEVNGETRRAEDRISLRHDENNVTLESALFCFFRASDIRYQTQLIGFDDRPSAWTSEPKRVYTNLPAGDYVFRVWARDYAGNMAGPVGPAFSIRPSPWKTWWAYLAYVGAAFGVGYLMYGWRIRRVRRRQEEKIKYLRRLLESTRVINSRLDLMTVLQDIAEESARLVDGEPGGIGLVENGSVVFKRIWLRDHWEESVVTFPLGMGVAGRVAETARTIVVNDPESSSEVIDPEMLAKYGVRGLMDVPILSRTGEVVGVLDVRRSASREPFTEGTARVVEALAHQAAVAIENAALYGELGRKNTELEEKNAQLEEKNLLVAESMTELEKLYRNERQVTRMLSDLNRMKVNFMIVTSHEMRTPLTVLKGYTEALLDGCLGGLTPSQQRSLSTCLRMVDRMVSSFNDILEMLKIHEGNIELTRAEFDLAGLVRAVAAEFASVLDQRRQRLTCDLPDRLSLNGDAGKIRLVLTNVIQNAIKFTHDDGEIRIAVVYESEVVRISVRDEGIGIDQTEIERIFDKFYTTADTTTHTSGKVGFTARGTGLGLSIARSYVEAHGGRIWAESKGGGQGSCFQIILPTVGPDLESRATVDHLSVS